MRFDQNRTVLAGLSTTQLQALLAQAQTAYFNLMTGAKVVTAGYDGKTVTYTQSNISDLQNFVLLIERALGIHRGRRALFPIFR